MPKLNDFFAKNEKDIKLPATKKMHLQNIHYKKIEESVYQYREISQEEIEKLADLIEMDGEVLQPLLVRKKGADTYEILAGHKRSLACKFLVEVRKQEKYAFIPCYIKELSDAQAEFSVYSTNGYNTKTDYEIMREIEGMERLIREHPEVFPEAPKGRMVERLAKVMGKSKTVVQEYKTISSNLGPAAMGAFKKEKISKDSAKALSSVPHNKQKEIIDKGLVKAADIKKYIKKTNEKDPDDGRKPVQDTAVSNSYILQKDPVSNSSVDNKVFNSKENTIVLQENKMLSDAPVNAQKPIIYQLKLDSIFFDDKLAGLKPFELRLNDRNYKVGDILEEWEYKDGEKTGRKARELVLSVLQDYTGLQDGYCILGTKLL